MLHIANHSQVIVVQYITPNIRGIPSIVLLLMSAFSIPMFISWMRNRMKKNQPGLNPISLWCSNVSTSCCVMVLRTNALPPWSFTAVFCEFLALPLSSRVLQRFQGAFALKTSLQVVRLSSPVHPPALLRAFPGNACQSSNE